MVIKPALISDLNIIREITRATVSEIYPHYYSNGAVEFFLNHHNDNNITNDITNNRVFLCVDCVDSKQAAVGTVTIKNNEICRLFVLPAYQGNGYGKALMDFAETKISEKYNEIKLAASLSAKTIYLKRGYKEIEYNTIKTDNGDFLCYDVMVKQV
ncbi:MAG: GNAT family N-acetyltransferase [Ruminococcaceae bacterium]|nr:GNAT family N-acetyltransferase [Oscillospiraceae bacterium]